MGARCQSRLFQLFQAFYPRLASTCGNPRLARLYSRSFNLRRILRLARLYSRGLSPPLGLQRFGHARPFCRQTSGGVGSHCHAHINAKYAYDNINAKYAHATTFTAVMLQCSLLPQSRLIQLQSRLLPHSSAV